VATERRAVERTLHEVVSAVCSLDRSQESADLVARKDHGQTLRSFGAYGIERAQLDFEHVLIKEKKTAQSLSLSARGYVAPDGQIGKEPFNLGRAYFAWMPLAVEQDESPKRMDVCLFGTIRVVFGA
jgi:hypothetical protein